jgi:tRNA threonylcarbamoyladenosine biosynthesis protein TsaE
MQIVTEIIYNIQQFDVVVTYIDNYLQQSTTMLFLGPLGSGKTSLIRSFLHAHGVTEDIVSPTFTYVQSYQLQDGRIVYHFDLYRITSLEQFYSLGFEEYIHQPDALLFIEWPEIIIPILKKPFCMITCSYHTDPEKRTVIFQHCD